ncbi:MAG: UvrD-helicase domain-containing protein [Acutalibacteraceae bacterium]
MADVTWTEEQLAAITARNPGILVSAGAGSGKTAVLTERVVQRIFDPVDPVDADRMLIVTFTRAAAEEMRERIAVDCGPCSGNTPRTVRWPGSSFCWKRRTSARCTPSASAS